MTKIYVATEGYYSDKSIIGLFSSMKNAENARNVFNSKNRIEEYELDEFSDKYDQGLKRYVVYISLTDSSSNCVDEWYKYSDIDVNQIKVRINKDLHTPFGLDMCMWARDEQHALKIASEKRAIYIEENL